MVSYIAARASTREMLRHAVGFWGGFWGGTVVGAVRLIGGRAKGESLAATDDRDARGALIKN